MSVIISVDTGNKAIKTPNYCFPAGLTSHGEEVPALPVPTLAYQGKYYTLSSQRIPYCYDKTINDKYQLLTLVAVAMELIGMYPGSPSISEEINLAVGLPLQHMAKLAGNYRDYFQFQGSPVKFTYNKVSFFLRFHQIEIFPQGYAAAMLQWEKVNVIPKSYIVDIGGYTTEVMMLTYGKPDLQLCESLEEWGMIRLFDAIKYRIRGEYHFSPDEVDIEAMLDSNQYYEEEFCKLAQEVAKEHAENLLHTLQEKGMEFKVGLPVFLGGGSKRLKPFLQPSLPPNSLFIDDVCSNAKGYQMLMESKLKAMNSR